HPPDRHQRGAGGCPEHGEDESDSEDDPDHGRTSGVCTAPATGRNTWIWRTRRRTTWSATKRYPSSSTVSPGRGTRPNSARISPPTVLTSSRLKLWPNTASISASEVLPSTTSRESGASWIAATSSVSC